MVVVHSFIGKVPLVDARGHHAGVRRGHQTQQDALVLVGVLDAHFEGRAIWLVPNEEDVSAQVQDGALHPFCHQKLLDLVGNVTLGDGPQVGLHALPGQIGSSILNEEIITGNEGQDGIQLFLGGVVTLPVDVPQVDERSGRDIEETAGQVGIFLGQEQDLLGLGRYGHPLLARRLGQLIQLAALPVHAEHVLQAGDLLEGQVDDSGVTIVVEGDLHIGVQQKVSLGDWLVLLTASAQTQQQDQGTE